MMRKELVIKLVILISWLNTSGCLLTPEIEEELQEILYPPEIILNQIIPEDNGTILLEEGCASQKLTFHVGQVRDLNKSDELWHRWIIDWEASLNRPDDPGYPVYPIENIPGEVTRKGPTYTLDFQDLFPRNLGDYHTLKVVIADRRLKAGGNGMEFYDPEGQLDSYQWTLKIAETGYCDLETE
jgi:hypothetical protein